MNQIQGLLQESTLLWHLVGLVDAALIRSLSRWILKEEEAGALTGSPSTLGPVAPHSGHAAAQLHGKVLHMLLQSLAGICLCPLLPCPFLLQLGQPQP